MEMRDHKAHPTKRTTSEKTSSKNATEDSASRQERSGEMTAKANWGDTRDGGEERGLSQHASGQTNRNPDQEGNGQAEPWLEH